VTNLLVNSSIGTKWLKPGLGITAMWVVFVIETQLVELIQLNTMDVFLLKTFHKVVCGFVMFNLRIYS
jgi:hypothetical protein